MDVPSAPLRVEQPSWRRRPTGPAAAKAAHPRGLRVRVLLPAVALCALEPAAAHVSSPESARAMVPACAAGTVPAFVPFSPREPARFELDPDSSRIGFDARATFGSFSGRATAFRGWAVAGDTASLRDVRGAVEVEVAGIRTGIGLRDRHLRDDLEADAYPVLAFALDSIRPEPPAAAAGPAAGAPAPSPQGGEAAPPSGRVGDGEAAAPAFLAYGHLTVRGVARPLAVPAAIAWTTGGAARVRGGVPIRFTDFGMDPPGRFLGLASVEDELTVRFDLLFRPAPTGVSAKSVGRIRSRPSARAARP